MPRARPQKTRAAANEALPTDLPRDVNSLRTFEARKPPVAFDPQTNILPKETDDFLKPDLPKLVSVVITCYNQARFLSDSIESVLNQTCKSCEIILVDDESKDHPEEIASQYPAIKFIRQKNQGVSVARNRGLQESSGDFLIFLDADDRLLPEAIEAGLKCFRAHPECGFVFGEGRLIDSNGNHIPAALHLYADGGYEEFLRENPIGFPALVMYRRASLEAVEGFRSFVNKAFISNTADYDLNLRLAQRYPVHCHRKLIAEWRVHSNNTSRNKSMMADSALVVLQSQRELIRGNKVLTRAWEQGLKNWRRYYLAELRVERARESARAGQWGQMAKNACWLFWFEPHVLLENVGRKLRVTLSRGFASKVCF